MLKHESSSRAQPGPRVAAPWTWILTLLLIGLNVGLFPAAPAACIELMTRLEYDGAAIHQGEYWRLLTGNLVHFSPNHFYLDVGVFLVLGLMYEPYLRRGFLPLVLVMCLAIGIVCIFALEERARMRGLSGVDAGLFAAALCIEFALAWREPSRWWWVAPAAGLFIYKTSYETITGQSVFGTQHLLGPIRLATTAHLAGVAAALCFMALRFLTLRFVAMRSNCRDRNAVVHASAPCPPVE